jgi:FMNH2-dependent dimethyl sulfone monooxygenase
MSGVSKARPRPENPMRGPQPFKIGLFGYLHDGGNALTTAPERWRAQWDDIEAMARMADTGGLDFLIPIARWKGVPGEINNRLWSFETLTHAAALAAVTKRIAIFSTVHTPIVHPIFAAKAMTTIDHVSHGRAGLNVVCGWNQYDFDMFAHTMLEHDERYMQGLEWFEIWSRLMQGPETEFDHDGKHFPGMKGVIGQPASVQAPRPVVINAASSRPGRDFAIAISDYLLTSTQGPEHGRRVNDELAARCLALGKPVLPTIATSYLVCRPTRKEAEDFHRYYAEEKGDFKAVDFYIGSRVKNASTPNAEAKNARVRFAGGNGAYPMIGAPEDIVAEMLALRDAGFAGTTLTFLNFLDDLPFFLSDVVPLMQQAGLRVPTLPAA